MFEVVEGARGPGTQAVQLRFLRVDLLEEGVHGLGLAQAVAVCAVDALLRGDFCTLA